jgi:hypothetical protein
MGVELIHGDTEESDFDDEQMMSLDLMAGSPCGNLAGKPTGAKPCAGRLVKVKPQSNPIDLFNDEEAVRETFAEADRKINRKKWGPWQVVDTSHGYRFLVYQLPGGEYSVPLCELKTDKGLLEWLRHLEDKTWGTAEVLGWLIKATFTVDDLPKPEKQPEEDRNDW